MIRCWHCRLRPSFFLAPSRRGEAELFNKQPIRRLGEDEGFLLPT
jgi:hypothetical protein